MFHSSSFSTSINDDCTAPDYKECNFTTPHLTPSSSASFILCTFKELTSGSNGGAIYFSSTGTLSIYLSSFDNCNARVKIAEYYGGGAVCVDSGTLVSKLNTFIHCTTTCWGGAIFGDLSCDSAYLSQCTFLHCKALFGGGLMSFYGPTSSVFSSRFISCTASQSGGGMYHDGYTTDSLYISDCIFTNNCAEYKNNSDSYQTRGGGAFEDYRTTTHTSQYSFSFFASNISPSGVGDDISIHDKELSMSSIQHCFTTTASHSLWNKKYTGFENWLPLSNEIIMVFDPPVIATDLSTNKTTYVVIDIDYHEYVNMHFIFVE